MRFFQHLAVERQMTASTQNQALNASKPGSEQISRRDLPSLGHPRWPCPGCRRAGGLSPLAAGHLSPVGHGQPSSGTTGTGPVNM